MVGKLSQLSSYWKQDKKERFSGVMGAHIHVGTSTQDGPILISLLNSSTSASITSNTNGILVKGTVTSSDIRGNLTGKQIMPHVSMNVSYLNLLICLLQGMRT
ncbi:MAG: CHRD domain-containing protein [Candidatus Nitrosopolaris sp.]